VPEFTRLNEFIGKFTKPGATPKLGMTEDWLDPVPKRPIAIDKLKYPMGMPS
jgi:hypothetical protein